MAQGAITALLGGGRYPHGFSIVQNIDSLDVYSIVVFKKLLLLALESMTCDGLLHCSKNPTCYASSMQVFSLQTQILAFKQYKH